MSASPAAPVAPCLKLFLRLLAVAMAAAQAWAGRNAIRPDGISYLDIADAYIRGDWHNAVSTYWSPLYSWLLCAGLAFRPPPFWQFAVVKTVNFGVFLAVLAAFEWFAHEVTLPQPDRTGETPAAGAPPRGVLFAFAYGLFLWSSCVLTSVAAVSPDLLVSGIVYLLAAWVLRARRVRPGVASSLLFGVILGIGCLAKAALLPLGLIFLFVSLFSAGSVRAAAARGAVAAAAMAVILGGWVGAMYEKAHRVTLGDVSRLNYVWIVNGVPDHGWEGQGVGEAVHPPRKLDSQPPALPALGASTAGLLASPLGQGPFLAATALFPRRTQPPVYEFKDPIPATFPLWYDPSYWCEGLTWRFDARQQMSAIAASLRSYYDLISSELLPFVAALALLHLGAWLASAGTIRARIGARLRSLAADYPLLVPSLGACAMYALVVVEPRYLAGFVVFLGMALLRAVRFPPENEAEMRRWGWAVVVVVILAPAVWLTGRDAFRAFGHGEPAGDWQVAEQLHERGVKPGAVVGSIGSPFDCGWARLGRFRIGAEVRSADVPSFWKEDDAAREKVFDAFRQAGAVAVVARNVPVTDRQWEQIVGTGYAVRVLSGPEGAP